MRTAKIASFGLAVFVSVSGCSTQKTYTEEELNILVAPITIDIMKETKKRCEERYHVPCVITGGFMAAPDVEATPPLLEPKRLDKRDLPI